MGPFQTWLWLVSLAAIVASVLCADDVIVYAVAAYDRVADWWALCSARRSLRRDRVAAAKLRHPSAVR